jgi:hypothetical protein
VSRTRLDDRDRPMGDVDPPAALSAAPSAGPGYDTEAIGPTPAGTFGAAILSPQRQIIRTLQYEWPARPIARRHSCESKR